MSVGLNHYGLLAFAVLLLLPLILPTVIVLVTLLLATVLAVLASKPVASSTSAGADDGSGELAAGVVGEGGATPDAGEGADESKGLAAASLAGAALAGGAAGAGAGLAVGGLSGGAALGPDGLPLSETELTAEGLGPDGLPLSETALTAEGLGSDGLPLSETALTAEELGPDGLPLSETELTAEGPILGPDGQPISGSEAAEVALGEGGEAAAAGDTSEETEEKKSGGGAGKVVLGALGGAAVGAGLGAGLGVGLSNNGASGVATVAPAAAASNAASSGVQSATLDASGAVPATTAATNALPATAGAGIAAAGIGGAAAALASDEAEPAVDAGVGDAVETLASDEAEPAVDAGVDDKAAALASDEAEPPAAAEGTQAAAETESEPSSHKHGASADGALVGVLGGVAAGAGLGVGLGVGLGGEGATAASGVAGAAEGAAASGTEATPLEAASLDAASLDAAPADAAQGEAGLAAPAAAAGAAVGGAAILARLKDQRARRQSEAEEAAKGPVIPVLYGSQTGTSEEIARLLATKLTAAGAPAKAHALDDFGFDTLSKEKTPTLVVVSSSTGDGDPPDNAARFLSQARRRSNPKDLLDGVGFSLLGLGDSNYTRFCHVPRSIRSKLIDLGAVEFYPGVDADEVDGLEGAVDPWTAGVTAAVLQRIAADGAGVEGGVAAAAAAGAGASLAASAAASADGSVPPVATPELRDDAGLNPAPSPSAAEAAALRAPTPLPPTRVSLRWLEPGSSEAREALQEERKYPGAEALRGEGQAPGSATAASPAWLPVTGARWLTTKLSQDRFVLHVELGRTDAIGRFEPGDALGVLAQNPPSLVSELLELLGLASDAAYEASPVEGERLPTALPPRGSARWVLAHSLEITAAPRKLVLRALASSATDEGEAAELLRLASPEGRADYAAKILEPHATLLDVLRTFPSAKPSLEQLVDVVPTLKPRFYSVSSSPLAEPNTLAIAFSLIRPESPSGPRPGVATSFLHSAAHPLLEAQQRARHAAADSHGLGGGDYPHAGVSRSSGSGGGSPLPPASAPVVHVPCFLRPGGDFRPPTDLSKPVVLVGPGTGVAPFRGFLLDRRAHAAREGLDPRLLGTTWLFFGCRKDDVDFLYKDELLSLVKDRTLGHLVVAFSRASGQKVYVQDLIKVRGEAVYQALARDGGSLYICGDGTGMARDVHSALLSIFEEHEGVGTTEAHAKASAQAALDALVAERRYVTDIWS